MGGYGADTLSGSSGTDKFVYLDIKDTGDTITDFTPGSDKIDLSALHLTNTSVTKMEHGQFAWRDLVR